MKKCHPIILCQMCSDLMIFLCKDLGHHLNWLQIQMDWIHAIQKMDLTVAVWSTWLALRIGSLCSWSLQLYWNMNYNQNGFHVCSDVYFGVNLYQLTHVTRKKKVCWFQLLCFIMVERFCHPFSFTLDIICLFDVNIDFLQWWFH